MNILWYLVHILMSWGWHDNNIRSCNVIEGDEMQEENAGGQLTC